MVSFCILNNSTSYFSYPIIWGFISNSSPPLYQGIFISSCVYFLSIACQFGLLYEPMSWWSKINCIQWNFIKTHGFTYSMYTLQLQIIWWQNSSNPNFKYICRNKQSSPSLLLIVIAVSRALSFTLSCFFLLLAILSRDGERIGPDQYDWLVGHK